MSGLYVFGVCKEKRQRQIQGAEGQRTKTQRLAGQGAGIEETGAAT
jgi:hypothetical protein